MTLHKPPFINITSRTNPKAWQRKLVNDVLFVNVLYNIVTQIKALEKFERRFTQGKGEKMGATILAMGVETPTCPSKSSIIFLTPQHCRKGQPTQLGSLL